MTLDFFQPSGNVPVDGDLLYRCVNGIAISSATCFRNTADSPTGPVDPTSSIMILPWRVQYNRNETSQ